MTCLDLDGPDEYVYVSFPTAAVVYGYLSALLSLIWIVLLVLVISDYENVVDKKTPELLFPERIKESQDTARDGIYAHLGSLGAIFLEVLGVDKEFKWALIPFMVIQFYMIYVNYLSFKIFFITIDYVHILTGLMGAYYIASVDCVFGLFRRLW